MNKKLIRNKYALTNNTIYGIITHTENKNGKFSEKQQFGGRPLDCGKRNSEKTV
mgnify:CR=1 FL=1